MSSQFSADRGQHILVSQTDEDVELMKEWATLWDELAGHHSESVSIGTMVAALHSTRAGRAVPDEVIVELLSEADTNKDGRLQKQEFMTIVDRTPRSGPLRAVVRNAAWCAVPISDRDYSTRYYYEQYSCWPPPLFVPLVSLLQIGVFVYYSVDMALPTAAMSPCPTYSPLVYDPARRYEAWRYVTYSAVHSGWLHILSNLLTQLLFGVVLEMVHGSARLSVIYMSGVACGALATSVSVPGYYLAGASGGVYAIQYAHLGNLVINWNEIKYPIPQAAFIGILSVVDISYSIYDTFYVLESSHTGHLAHIGGALCGLLLGVCVLRNLRKLPWERYCVIGAGVLLSFLVLVTVMVNAFYPAYFPDNDYTSLHEIKQNWMIANHGSDYYLKG